MLSPLHQKLLTLQKSDLDAFTLEVFQFQAQHNPIYAAFLRDLKCEVSRIQKIEDIPFLPVSAFKRPNLQTGQWQAHTFFQSSGTTSQTPSIHLLRQADWYLQRARSCWEFAYQKPVEDFAFFALLPSYLERGHSSLVFMVNDFVQRSQAQHSNFFLHADQNLRQAIEQAQAQNQTFVLWGVAYALLDFAEKFGPLNLQGGIVLETGGMKGRRAEMPKFALHQTLQQAFQVPQIHTEYGMTEMLSQAYALENGRFHCPDGLQIHLRQITDPFASVPNEKVGTINIIDLYNLDTCCFLATEDLGRIHSDGSFEVLGRLDGAELRGCNLLLSE